jgi:hypothetical protein
MQNSMRFGINFGKSMKALYRRDILEKVSCPKAIDLVVEVFQGMRRDGLLAWLPRRDGLCMQDLDKSLVAAQ